MNNGMVPLTQDTKVVEVPCHHMCMFIIYMTSGEAIRTMVAGSWRVLYERSNLQPFSLLTCIIAIISVIILMKFNLITFNTYVVKHYANISSQNSNHLYFITKRL